jgi:hypothetical protein
MRAKALGKVVAVQKGHVRSTASKRGDSVIAVADKDDTAG